MAYTKHYTIDAGPAGDTVKDVITVKIDGNIDAIFADLNTHEALTTGSHGVGSGTIVGTALTQTLTNKTISGGTLTGAITADGLTLTGYTAPASGLTYTNATLTGTTAIWQPTLTNSSLVGATLSGTITWTTPQLTNPTITHATLTGTITASGVTWVGLDTNSMTNGTINGATLSGTITNTAGTITGGTITGATITGSTVYGYLTTVDSTTISSATLSACTLGSTTTTNGGTLAGGTINGTTLTGTITATGATWIGLPAATDLTGGTITNCTITGTITASGATFISPTITGSTLANPTIAVASSTNGDMWYQASGKVARLAKGIAGNHLMSDGTSPYWGMADKIIDFSYDTTSLAGTQAITGVGFTPSRIFFGLFGNLSIFESWGYSDGTNHKVRMRIYTGNWSYNDTQCLYFYQTGDPVRTYAHVNSMDADGFTLDWAKDGSPTGTAYILAHCFR